MRKTGLYILLGVTISVAIFVLAGILYFQPSVMRGEERIQKVPSSLVEAEKVEVEKVEAPKEAPKVEQPKPIEKEVPPQIVEKTPEEKAPAIEVEEVVPKTPEVIKIPGPVALTLTVTPYEEPQEVLIEEPTPELEEVLEKEAVPADIEEPVAREQEISPPIPQIISVPQVEELELQKQAIEQQEPAVTEEEPAVEPVVTEEEPIVEPVVTEEEPVVEPVVTEEEPVVEPVVTEEEPVVEPVVVEEEPVVEPVVVEEEPVVEPVVTEEEPVVEPVVTEEEPVVEEKKQVFVPSPLATFRVNQVLPQIKEPEVIWTPVEIPEAEAETLFIPPSDFNQAATDRRKDAVDEILSNLKFD
jgi:hypothetical protein